MPDVRSLRDANFKGLFSVRARLVLLALIMVVPFMADQRFWGERVARLGAGPRPFSRKRFSAERFAAALRELVGDPRHAEGASRCAGALASEDGVARAVAALPF